MRRRFTDDNWPEYWERDRPDFREGNPGADEALAVTYLPSGAWPGPVFDDSDAYGDLDEDETEEWRRGG